MFSAWCFHLSAFTSLSLKCVLASLKKVLSPSVHLSVHRSVPPLRNFQKRIWRLLVTAVQCEHCQMQKSIKLLLLDASSLWPGINLLSKYYVWHFLYQNFIGLSWIVCPQHQIEVKEAFQEKVIFSSNSSFSIREVFLPYVLIWRWLEP